MQNKLSDKIRLIHISEAISEIFAYTQNVTFDQFSANSMMRLASVKQLEIIGEAAKHISNETKNAHPDVAWSRIISLRNILVHEYFGIDENIIWDILKYDLPVLETGVITVLKSLEA